MQWPLLIANQYTSLVATIRAVRPDLLLDKAHNNVPIPTIMPQAFLAEYKKKLVEDIGEPTTASFFNRHSIDPTNW